MNKMLSKEACIPCMKGSGMDKYCTDNGVYEAMDTFAEQEAIAFAEWKDNYYIQHPNGYYSKFNDDSHGKSHITPTFHTLTGLYKIYQQSKPQQP